MKTHWRTYASCGALVFYVQRKFPLVLLTVQTSLLGLGWPHAYTQLVSLRNLQKVLKQAQTERTSSHLQYISITLMSSGESVWLIQAASVTWVFPFWSKLTHSALSQKPVWCQGETSLSVPEEQRWNAISCFSHKYMTEYYENYDSPLRSWKNQINSTTNLKLGRCLFKKLLFFLTFCLQEVITSMLLIMPFTTVLRSINWEVVSVKSSVDALVHKVFANCCC